MTEPIRPPQPNNPEVQREREDIRVIYNYVRQYLEMYKGEPLDMSEAVVARQMIQDVYNKSIDYWKRFRNGICLTEEERPDVLGEIADDTIDLFLRNHIGLPAGIMVDLGESGGLKMKISEIRAIWKKRNRDSEII